MASSKSSLSPAVIFLLGAASATVLLVFLFTSTASPALPTTMTMETDTRRSQAANGTSGSQQQRRARVRKASPNNAVRLLCSSAFASCNFYIRLLCFTDHNNASVCRLARRTRSRGCCSVQRWRTGR